MNSKMQLPLQTRAQQPIEQRGDTFTVTFSTGAAVRRYDFVNGRYYMETLSLDKKAIRMDRLNSGAPLLNSHSSWSVSDVLGVTSNARIENGAALVDVQFSQRDEVAPVVQDVRDKILRNVSVGYAIHRMEMIEPAEENAMWEYRAIDWEPMEVSLVPIPADAGAQVRKAETQFECEVIHHPANSRTTTERQAMTEKVVASGDANKHADEVRTVVDVEALTKSVQSDATTAERKRVSEINDIATRANLPAPWIAKAINEGWTVERARSTALDEMIARQKSIADIQATGAVKTVVDESDTRREALTQALMHRANAVPVKLDAGRKYAGLNLMEMARESLREQGVDVAGKSRMELAGLALGMRDQPGLISTSDFSIAMSNTMNRTLRQEYDVQAQTFRPWCRRASISDFRPVTRASFGANVKLEKVNEHGEYKRGSVADRGETYSLATYGKIIGVTRQVMINDDLDVLGRIPVRTARAAANLESDTVYSILSANAAMSDTVALFHGTHNNLGTAGAISETTLSEARTKMRKQQDPDDQSFLNIIGRFLIVGPGRETEAQKIVNAQIVAAKTADTNVFRSSYEIIVEPRIGGSPEPWYIAADPASIDTIEYAYLDGQDGLYSETQQGFEVDGMQIKVRMDFAAKAIDWRGLYRNAGV